MTEHNATLEKAIVPYWVVILARSLALLIAGIVVTFNADHSPQLGLAIVGSLAIVTGALHLVGSRASSDGGVERALLFAHGAVSLLAGIAAITLSAGLPFLIFIVVAWGLITGGLELALGVVRRGHPVSRDWIFAGALTIVLAIVAIVMPHDLQQVYVVDEKERFLTSSIVLVGIIGAYCAVLGVYLAIAAFSLKWATKEPVAASVAESEL